MGADMPKTLRRKFILISMAALSVVLFVLLLGINLANYWVSTDRQDRILRSIADNRHPFPPRLPAKPKGAPPSPEANAMLRFFAIRLDETGGITDLFLEHISSVSAADAAAYSQRVSESGRSYGYCGEYRYYVCRDETGSLQLFLNSSSQLQFMKTLLLLSFLTALGSLLLLFFLVSLLSKWAVRPYVRNMEAQKRFITDAGHELKTPLTSLSTSVDMLLLEGGENEWAENIRRQTERLSRLVTNLVTLSRLDEDRPIPEKTDFPLDDILWESAEPFVFVAKAEGKHFEIDLEDRIRLHGDPASIRQMASLLLDNAMRYSDSGGTIRLSARRVKKKIRMEFFNTCDKIETKDLDRLFERFYRSDRSRSSKTGGTGVGLSIARGIARAHGGEITVKSPDGNSIRFTVIL